MKLYDEIMKDFDEVGYVLGREIFQLRYFDHWHDKKITREMFFLLTDLKNFTHYQFFTLDGIEEITNQQIDIIDFLQGNFEYANIYDVNIHVLNWGDEEVVYQYLVDRWNEEHNNGEYLEDISKYDYFFFENAKKEFKDEITIIDFEGYEHQLPLKNRTRICLNSSRGIGKSVITQSLSPWTGLLDPNITCIVGAADDGRAINFNKQVRSYVKNNDVLTHLIPAKNDTDSANAFNFGCRRPQDSPSFKAVGLMSKKMTGSRGDIIVLDDVEVPNNVMTEKSREQLSERVKEAAAVLKTKKTGGIQRIIYLGTPQTEDTLYRKLPERGYTLRVFPARIPSEEQYDNMKDTLCPRTKLFYLENPQSRNGYGQYGDRGMSIDSRMNEEELIDREMEYGRVGFDQQFMLDPSGSDRDKFPLKLTDLIITDLDRDKTYSDWHWSSLDKYVLNDLHNIGLTGDFFRTARCDETTRYEYERSIMVIDPSGKGKDETAYVIVKELHGYLYLCDLGGFKDGYEDETLEKLVEVGMAHNIDTIVLEENFGGGMYEKLLLPFIKKAKADFGISQVWQSKQKELRIIDTLEPVMKQHRLIVDRAVVVKDFTKTPEWVQEQDAKRNYMLFYQMTRITKERGAIKHDDRLDALAMAVQFFADVLCLDTLDEKKDNDELMAVKIFEEGLEHFLDCDNKLVASPKEKEHSLGYSLGNMNNLN